MRVLIIDDHIVVRKGTRLVLEHLSRQLKPGSSPDFIEAGSVKEAAQHAGVDLDLILLDFHLPGVSGIAALDAVLAAFEGVPVVVFSGDDDPHLAETCIEAGAAGFVPKRSGEQEIDAALRLVLSRGVYVPSSALFDEQREGGICEELIPSEQLAEFLSTELSPRQRQVLARAIRGKPNKTIARELGIAEGTVKVHLAMVFRAIGVRNRAQAIFRVFSAGAAHALDSFL